MKKLGNDLEQTCLGAGVYRGERASADSLELSGRCLFSNHCLCLRLLALPAGSNVGPCLAGCTGLILVSHGALELSSQASKINFAEGDAIPLPIPPGAELWPAKSTDILLFEHRKRASGPEGSRLRRFASHRRRAERDRQRAKTGSKASDQTFDSW